MIPDLSSAAGLVVLQGSVPVDSAARIRHAVGSTLRVSDDGAGTTVTWGAVDAPADGAGTVLVLGARNEARDLAPEAARAAAVGGGRDVLPPFAVAVRDGSVTTVRTDSLGFRQIYSAATADAVGLSTSSIALASALRRGVDRAAIAVQSRLGWQVGGATPFEGVSVLGPGAAVELRAGRLDTSPAIRRPHVPRRSLADAAPAAAQLLRELLSAFLDEHPDAILQLTGGQDSRILLGAIPRSRRREVDVMTLAVPGSEDAHIAATIAKRYGMRHHVVTLEGAEELEPSEAYDLCCRAAVRLDCSADPVAYASLAFPESRIEPRPRLSGLGGEFARGFYYFGRLRELPVSRARVERLARWRMFPNESVDRSALDPEFDRWASSTAVDAIHDAFVATDASWWDATDEFYLGERMRRWAGTLASATAFDRAVVNPMLDHRFLDLARSVAPREKRGARYLSSILVELDDELASIPMDGRPAPATFATTGARRTVTLGLTEARRMKGKVAQRLSRTRRPPAGADVLASRVVEHWRATPSELAGVAQLGVFDAGWLERLVEGSVDAGPSTVALLVNLCVAAKVSGGSDPGRAEAVPDASKGAAAW